MKLSVTTILECNVICAVAEVVSYAVCLYSVRRVCPVTSRSIAMLLFVHCAKPRVDREIRKNQSVNWTTEGYHPFQVHSTGRVTSASFYRTFIHRLCSVLYNDCQLIVESVRSNNITLITIILWGSYLFLIEIHYKCC